MKNYYYIDRNGQQAGPVPENQLLQYGVTANTNVWCEGMGNWEIAARVPELSYLFIQTPPRQPVEERRYEPCPDNHMAMAIISTLLCCWPIGIFAIIKANKVSNLWHQGRKHEAYEAANSAKNLATASMVLGFIISVIYVIYMSAVMGGL